LLDDLVVFFILVLQGIQVLLLLALTLPGEPFIIFHLAAAFLCEGGFSIDLFLGLLLLGYLGSTLGRDLLLGSFAFLAGLGAVILLLFLRSLLGDLSLYLLDESGGGLSSDIFFRQGASASGAGIGQVNNVLSVMGYHAYSGA
jgi:hypothetical protein